MTESENKVVDVYYAAARADSHGAALYAATVEGRKLGLSDSAIKRLIEGSSVEVTLAPSVVDVSTIREYGLSQKLSAAVRCF